MPLLPQMNSMNTSGECARACMASLVKFAAALGQGRVDGGAPPPILTLLVDEPPVAFGRVDVMPVAGGDGAHGLDVFLDRFPFPESPLPPGVTRVRLGGTWRAPDFRGTPEGVARLLAGMFAGFDPARVSMSVVMHGVPKWLRARTARAISQREWWTAADMEFRTRAPWGQPRVRAFSAPWDEERLGDALVEFGFPGCECHLHVKTTLRRMAACRLTSLAEKQSVLAAVLGRDVARECVRLASVAAL